MKDDQLPLNTATPSKKYTFFKPQDDQDAAKKLLTHVLHGNLEKVLQILDERPELLFIEASAEEWASGFENETEIPVHRIVKLSPLQAMAAAGDIEMLYISINRIPSNYRDKKPQEHKLVLAVKQLHQQFPNGFNYPESQYDFVKLAKVISDDKQLMNFGEPDDNTITAIKKSEKNSCQVLSTVDICSI